MAVESKVKIDYKGLEVLAPAAYSRFLRAIIDAVSGTELVFADYPSAEAATKIMSKRPAAVDYDPGNPVQKAQYEEEMAKYVAAGNLQLWESAASQSWRPTVAEEYWDGKTTVGEALQEREVPLPSDIALAFAAQALVGELPREPKDALEMLTAQAYLAAIAAGAFVDAKAV